VDALIGQSALCRIPSGLRPQAEGWEADVAGGRVLARRAAL